MPMPEDVRHASRDFEAWMSDLRARTFLATGGQCYSSLRAVLHEVRKHLNTDVAVAFGDLLPPLVRGIYYEGWRPFEAVQPLVSIPQLTESVVASLAPHIVPPITIVTDVFAVMAGRLDGLRARIVVDRFPPLLARLWKDAAKQKPPRVF